jgi:oxygen-independent coproporphyrinogen-3 oxidase
VERAEEYVREMRARGSARLERTAANLQEERFFVGLRLTEGIRPAASEWNFYARPIERFLAEGLLERSGEMLRLTNRGVLVSNEVFAEFLAA